MSQENVEIAESAFRALARADFESFFAVLDQRVEWVNPPYAVEPGTRRGTAEFSEALARMRASFGSIRVKVDEVVEASETAVVVTGRWTGEGTGSGIQLENHFSSVLTLRDGKVVRYEWFREKAEALEAVGLSEQFRTAHHHDASLSAKPRVAFIDPSENPSRFRAQWAGALALSQTRQCDLRPVDFVASGATPQPASSPDTEEGYVAVLDDVSDPGDIQDGDQPLGWLRSSRTTDPDLSDSQ